MEKWIKNQKAENRYIVIEKDTNIEIEITNRKWYGTLYVQFGNFLFEILEFPKKERYDVYAYLMENNYPENIDAQHQLTLEDLVAYIKKNGKEE